MKSLILSLAGAALLATAATACGSTSGDLPRTTPEAASATPAADAPSKRAGHPTDPDAYARAKALWKQKDQVALAEANTYVEKAAEALKAAGNPDYDDEVAELTELAGLPHNGLTDEQVATTKKDTEALDRFFGTSRTTGGSGSGTSQVAQACRTSDLRFTVTEESQKGGYYLITASAKPGVSCALKGVYPAAAFGSAADSQVSPAEQAVGRTIRLSGSKKAYAGVNPRTVNSDAAVEYPQITVAISNDDPDPVSIRLDSPAPVNGPVATNWYADATEPVQHL